MIGETRGDDILGTSSPAIGSYLTFGARLGQDTYFTETSREKCEASLLRGRHVGGKISSCALTRVCGALRTSFASDQQEKVQSECEPPLSRPWLDVLVHFALPLLCELKSATKLVDT